MKLTAVFFSVAISALVLPLSVSAHETGDEHKHFFVNAKGDKHLDANNGEVAPPAGMSQGFGSVTCSTSCIGSNYCTTTCF